ncbi:MAG: CarD family transcriptional regulator [Alphaproteobacteria bacterium]
MSKEVQFSVGDRVVYPSHGVGAIIAEEVQAIGGMDINVFVISFPKEKMILRVPVKRAAVSGLRQISSDTIIKKVVSILQSKPKVEKVKMWSRRAQDYENKINSGDIVSLAEVVRDLYKNVDDPDRSYSERVIYDSAISRLAGEFAAVENIDAKIATEKLIDILRDKQTAEAA